MLSLFPCVFGNQVGKSTGQLRSFRQIRRVFEASPTIDEDNAAGYYQSRFVGPVCLKALVPVVLPLIGLKGWCGKRLLGNGHALNLVRKSSGATQEVIPMNVTVSDSVIDGRRSLLLTYPASTPFPLRYFVDELRMLDNSTLLGLTVIDLPVVRHFPLPFLLQRPWR